MPVISPSRLLQDRVDAIRQYHKDTGIKRAELDVSGGIDSAVMAGLLVLALGAENVTFAHLAINSNPEQTERAKRLINAIGGKLAVADFSAAYQMIVTQVINSIIEAEPDGPYGGPGLRTPREHKRDEIRARLEADPTILGSIRSTLRAPLGRAYNRITGGGIRHGTGNECEDRFLRFYQKGGDGEVDSNPIAMLSKAEVYQLAYELGWHFEFGQERSGALAAYQETIGAIPSADLWANGDAHNDEDEISRWLGAKFTYGKLDPKTGKVVSIGTIERVARFLDESSDTWDNVPYEKFLFADEPKAGWEPDILAGYAAESPAFKGSGLSRDQIEALLRGARKAERQTRHKMNPNCPALGTRKELLDKGILTDDFTAYGVEAPATQTAAVPA